MQTDIRQENRMNTLTISEGQKMYLKFFKDIKTRILTPQNVFVIWEKLTFIFFS
jgi:hypothetical protein